MKSAEFYRNKVVLITGASMGIGKEMALQVLSYGGKVAITDINEARLLAVQHEQKEHSENMLIHMGDVGDYEDAAGLVEKVILRFGRLDVLVNNAGMSNDSAELASFHQKVVDEIIDTNIKGSIFYSMLAIPELQKTRGSILFISSIASFRGLPGYSLYSLSKMALTTLAQSLRIETKKAGVFVGISYISFTENEPAKRTLSNEGKLKQVPDRNKILTRPRSVTAKILLNQIANRKHRVVHSGMGKFTFFVCKYAPGIANLIYEQIYNKKQVNH